MVYIFFITKTKHTNKDICDQNWLKKMFKFVFHMMFERQSCPQSQICTARLGREPNLLGSASDMYTVHTRSKICLWVPPCIFVQNSKMFIALKYKAQFLDIVHIWSPGRRPLYRWISGPFLHRRQKLLLSEIVFFFTMSR